MAADRRRQKVSSSCDDAITVGVPDDGAERERQTSGGEDAAIIQYL